MTSSWCRAVYSVVWPKMHGIWQRQLPGPGLGLGLGLEGRRAASFDWCGIRLGCSVGAVGNRSVWMRPRGFLEQEVSTWQGTGVRCFAGKKSKGPAKLSFNLPVGCECNRCQIMRMLLDRYEEIQDKVETIPQITTKHVTLGFARSGGAGGQNVNKVNTKVDMRFNVMAAEWLPERVRTQLMKAEKNRINKDGEIVVASSKSRSQRDNVEDALERLQDMIEAAYKAAPSEKDRIVDLLTRLERSKGK